MSTVQEITDAIRHLSESDQAFFRAWFAEFDAANWDSQFEEDVRAGKLDWLVKEARDELRAGRCTDR